MPTPGPDHAKPGLMRSLGRFTGHLLHAVRATPKTTRAPVREEVRREVEQADAELPDGRRVTLRRTTIEEVEINDHP